MCFCFFFFFSSRRRHTRLTCDWSSDVCSSDLSELAKPMKMTMPAVTKHLKVLQKAGLIRQERRAQFRPCYLVAAPLEQAADWVEQYRKFWEESFNRLDDYLKVLQAQNVSETVNKKPTRKKKDE